MHLLDVGILPLETGGLLGCLVSIDLNGFEHLRSKLGLEGTQRTLLFKLLDDYVFQLVHFVEYLAKFSFL